MNIRLSKNHGANPAIATCFWCGDTIGVALCGHLPGDIKAPRAAAFDYNPCEKCRENFARGIALFEVTEKPGHEHQPPINASLDAGVWVSLNNESLLYPTGRLVVVRTEAMQRILAPGDFRERVLQHGRAYVAPDIFVQFIPDQDDAGSSN